MRRTVGAILFRVMLAALTLAGACMPALAVEWPAPPDKWWESLSPGDTATFEIAMNTDPPMKMKVIIKVLDMKDSKITISTTTSTDGKPMPEQTHTVDAKGKNLRSSLPEYAKVTKIGEKVFKAGDHTLNCTEYLVKTYDASTNICHSTKLPLIFNDGNVTMEVTLGGIRSTMTLKEYTGKKLEVSEKLEE
jgi:hypothetical protein